MEFKNLALAIQQHLLRSGRAILPGMGVLQLHYNPARLHRQEGRIVPPSELPEFEPLAEDVIHDLDNELLAFYQKVSGIQQEDLARKDLQKQFQLVKEALEDSQAVSLPEVGTFQQVKDGGLAFEPSTFNYYLEVYGLGAVSARPVLRRTPEEAARVAQEERSTVTVRPQVKPARSWKDKLFLPGLAALLILSIAGCLWLIFSPEENPALQEASALDPSGMAVPEEGFADSSPGDVTEDLLEDPEVELPEADTLVLEDEAPIEPPVPSGVRIAVGHFGNAENVTGVIERLEKAGFTPGSEPTRGSLTRVFITVDPRVQSPADALAVIKRDFEPTAWILNQ